MSSNKTSYNKRLDINKIVITGTRNGIDKDFLYRMLEEHCQSPCLVAHGGARGVDRQVAYWLEEATGAVFPVCFHAPWYGLGKVAGSQRNIVMLKTVVPDLVLAFPGPESIGTWHCVNYARSMGLATKVFEPQRADLTDQSAG